MRCEHCARTATGNQVTRPHVGKGRAAAHRTAFRRAAAAGPDVATIVLLLGVLLLAGCDRDPATEPGLEEIMPIMLGLPETSWDIHTSMMGDTARVVLRKPDDAPEVELYLRVTWGSCEIAGQIKSKPICQVEIQNAELAAAIGDCLEEVYPGFWDRPLWQPHDYEGRWLAYGNRGQPGRPNHRAALIGPLYRTLLRQGLRLNEKIGLSGEHLPNGPFDRHELVLWFIFPEEMEG